MFWRCVLPSLLLLTLVAVATPSKIRLNVEVVSVGTFVVPVSTQQFIGEALELALARQVACAPPLRGSSLPLCLVLLLLSWTRARVVVAWASAAGPRS
jgi:hypothetical protein